ncbi:MAG: C-terminal helicase domain-containing protein [Planctomycetaceae bacterium]
MAALRALLFDQLGDEKVLVFTEFRETAVELWHAFVTAGGIGLIHGDAAFLGSLRAGRREVVQRFAPLANGSIPPPPREAVRVLIATDVLSEGLNLQDATHVVSYDLPWNPVRLMQRIGRIDRLGSRHATVYAHHFLPDAGLDAVLGLLERLRRKLAAIRSGLSTGATTGSVTHGATLGRRLSSEPATRTHVDRIVAEDPLVLDELDADGAPDALMERQLRRVIAGVQPVTGSDPPLGILPGCFDEGVIVGLRWRSRSWIVRADETGEITVRDELTMHALHTAATDGRAAAKTMDPGRAAENARPLFPTTLSATITDRDIARARAAVTAVLVWLEQAARARLAAGSPAAAVARRIRLAAAAAPGGPDSALCVRVDRLLATLAAGVRAGDEAALAALAGRWDRERTADVFAICDDVEQALRAASRSVADVTRGYADQPAKECASKVTDRTDAASPEDAPRLFGCLVLASSG